MLQSLRRLRSTAIHSAAWRPSNLRMLASQVVARERNARAGYGDADHLRAAGEWLERAQDATGDGGVSGRYLLRDGWTSSYPETTGYIVPTFLALAKALNSERFVERARKCVNFLESVRLSNGAFPGGEVRENRTEPSVFNTAQVINGLVAWHAATGDQRAIDMAVDAGDWLVSLLEDDGAWRKYVYRDSPVAYSSHASCWLAQLGVHTRDGKFLDAARRHMEWVLTHQDLDTGWFDRVGWDENYFRGRYGETHTIAYTIWGVLYTADACAHPAGLTAARKAAKAVARRLELSRTLAGKLDFRWRPRADYQCLTGNSQMALIWLRLDELEPDPTLVNAALKAIDLVKAAQPMGNPNLGIRGGIPGSDPVWGDYIRFGVPNWSAKFHIDSLLAKRESLARLRTGPMQDAAWTPPADVPRSLPVVATKSRDPLRIVMYTRPGSHKVPQMVDAWASWGFKPTTVVIEEPRAPSIRKRFVAKVREEGVGALIARLTRLSRSGYPRDAGTTRTSRDVVPARPTQDASTWTNVNAYCAAKGIPVVRVESLETEAGIDQVRSLQADLAIHAGAGIIRAPLLAVPRIGTINAHMGLLPLYRGMNVAEWARFLGGPLGCTVHFVDAGIDTGDIICVRQVNLPARSIAELRSAIDREQIELMGEVTRWIAQTGARPPAYKQRAQEGIQFFRLHPELADILQAELRDDGGTRVREAATFPTAAFKDL